MVDEGTDGDESSMDEVSIVCCDEEDNGRTRYPSSQNEQIVTNDVCKELTSMLLNTCRLYDIGTSCYELMSMMELGKFEKGSIFSNSRGRNGLVPKIQLHHHLVM